MGTKKPSYLKNWVYGGDYSRDWTWFAHAFVYASIKNNKSLHDYQNGSWNDNTPYCLVMTTRGYGMTNDKLIFPTSIRYYHKDFKDLPSAVKAAKKRKVYMLKVIATGMKKLRKNKDEESQKLYKKLLKESHSKT